MSIIFNTDLQIDNNSSPVKYQTVADITARDTIPEINRWFGMDVYIESEDQKYRLLASVDTDKNNNANWSVVNNATPIDNASDLVLDPSGSYPPPAVNVQQALEQTETKAESNSVSISDIESDVSNLQTDVSTLQTEVGDNTTDISTLQSDVSTNTSDIATNATNIATNVTNISTNTSDIGTNTSNISTNTANISGNTTNIGTNTTDIANNTGNISTNTTNISTNTTNISTNATDISGNTSDITALQGNIADPSTFITAGNRLEWTGSTIDLVDGVSPGGVYVSTIGGSDVNTTTPTLLQFETTIYEDTGIVVSSGAGTIFTVQKAGLYQISYGVNWDSQNNQPKNIRVTTAFNLVEYTASASHGLSRNNANDLGANNKTFQITLPSGAQIFVQGEGTGSGTGSSPALTIPGESSLGIFYLGTT